MTKMILFGIVEIAGLKIMAIMTLAKIAADNTANHNPRRGQTRFDSGRRDR